MDEVVKLKSFKYNNIYFVENLANDTNNINIVNHSNTDGNNNINEFSYKNRRSININVTKDNKYNIINLYNIENNYL